MTHRGLLTNLIIALVSVAFCLLSAWLYLPPAPTGFGWDEAWYVWMAEWFSGRPEHQPTALLMMNLRQYPPLFPYLLSRVGSLLADPANGFYLNSLFLSAGAGLGVAWLVRAGVPLAIAVLAGILMAFNPVALEFGTLLMSEPLFLLLTTAALLLVTRQPASGGQWLAVGLIAGLAVATRSTGWALVLALALSAARERRLNHILPWLAGLAAGFLFLFYLEAGLPEAQSYSRGFRDTLAEFDLAFLSGQVQALWSGWKSTWGSALGASIALVWLLPGWLVRLSQARADALYVLVSLLVILAWPFPDQMGRFLWVLMPALLVSGQASAELVNQPRLRPFVTGIVLAVVVVLSWSTGMGRTLDRLSNPPPGDLARLSRMADWTRTEDAGTALMRLRVNQQILADLARIGKEAPDGLCIYSELSALVSIQTRRVSMASPWNALSEVESIRLRCPYYYLVPDGLHGVTDEEFDRFSSTYREIFRSPAPYDASGKTVLGAFYDLRAKN